MWSYIIVAVTCLGVGIGCVLIYPKKERVRMNIGVPYIINKTLLHMGMHRFEWIAYDEQSGQEERGVSWAKSEQAVYATVHRRYRAVVSIVRTDRLPITDTDRIVY